MKSGIKLQGTEVFILAPTGQDAQLLANALMREGMRSAIYKDAASLCSNISEKTDAILVAEEALSNPALVLFSKAIEEQEPWSDIPIIVMTGNGEVNLSSLRVLKAFSPSGNVSLLERPFRPITLISTLQVALRARRRQHQVRELLEFQVQATQLRDDFISIASHELKTPLTSLKLQAQLNKRLRNKNPSAYSESTGRLIDSTEKQVDRLTRLVEDLLDASRINSGKLLIRPVHFDLTELVTEVLERFLPQFETVGITLNIVMCEPILGHWDRFRIEQVLNNLMTNAIRYSPGKPLHVSVSRADNTAKLIVRDEGQGISPENQERIFERFERAATKSHESGLGLGLYICREILESHHGTIRVESAPLKGAKFIVELPIDPGLPQQLRDAIS